MTQLRWLQRNKRVASQEEIWAHYKARGSISLNQAKRELEQSAPPVLQQLVLGDSGTEWVDVPLVEIPYTESQE